MTVTNVNEAPAITSNGGGARGPVSVAENTTAVTTVMAQPIRMRATTLTYSIWAGRMRRCSAINASDRGG